MIDVDYVVWDFDGVINRSTLNGEFLWSKTFEDDLGVSFKAFDEFVFSDSFSDVLSGKKDLLEHIEDWLETSGSGMTAREILSYWFERDATIDPAVLNILHKVRAAGVKNVIATNNEHHRCRYIETDLGFQNHVEAVFSSGRMKCMKPDRRFFDQIVQALAVPADRLILIDDSRANVDGASRCGWNAYHFADRDYSALGTRLGLN